jgi:diaminopimelate epimerase
LRIFNPDGSEAEKSGNGLRIFARALFDQGQVRQQPFSVATLGGEVICQVDQNGRQVTVKMGAVSFDNRRIPVTGPPREVLNETLTVGDHQLAFCAATVGNPHCVILMDRISSEEAQRYGPLIEHDSRFPDRINVQFMRVVDRSRIAIEIWERGAGYTLASGSSSTAAAAVAHKLGLCDRDITVEMPGGELQIRLNLGFEATMTGPVTPVAKGTILPDMFNAAQPTLDR